jgi:hypothetical protein
MRMPVNIEDFIRVRCRPFLKNVYFAVISLVASLVYCGNRVACPLCGGTFRKFLPFKGRPGARCPRCGALERYRLLWLYLKNRTEFFQRDMMVLEVGPTRHFRGNCRKLKNIKYVGVDI